MDRDERWPGQSWGAPEPLETRWDALTDLHDGKGTRWVKDPHRGFWADCCDKHRPAEIIEARRAETARREAAERALAAHRGKPYVPPVDAPDVVTSTVDPTPPESAPRRFDFLRRKRTP